MKHYIYLYGLALLIALSVYSYCFPAQAQSCGSCRSVMSQQCLHDDACLSSDAKTFVFAGLGTLACVGVLLAVGLASSEKKTVA